MYHAYLRQELLDKQAAGIPLSAPEAREMVVDLKRCIAEQSKTYDAIFELLLLSAVGSHYYEFVWDVLMTEGTEQ